MARFKLIYECKDNKDNKKIELFSAIVNYSHLNEISCNLSSDTKFCIDNGRHNSTYYWSNDNKTSGHYFEYELLETGENGILYVSNIYLISEIISPLFRK
jgi:hypothetical protein